MTEKLIVISLLFILYTYFGYPLVLYVWTQFKSAPRFADHFAPAVTVIISAYNEEECIGEALRSILSSDYSEPLRVVVASDGSTDKTDEIVSSFPQNRVRLLRGPGHYGKQKMLATFLADVPDDIVIVADASSIFRPDTVLQTVRHFHDPRVGSVTGSKRIQQSGTALSQSDGLYWRYESWLRRLESLTGSSWSGVEGGLFAIRKKAFRLNFPQECSSDYSICSGVLQAGFVNRYDPTAIIYEPASQDFQTEFSRKIRVIVRHIRAFFHFSYLLNPLRNPNFSFQNISHRLFRWLIPFFLILLGVCCVVSTHPASKILLISQVGFYAVALVGIALRWRTRQKTPRIFSIPIYFTLMNFAALLSWMFLFRHYESWLPPSREAI